MLDQHVFLTGFWSTKVQNVRFQATFSVKAPYNGMTIFPKRNDFLLLLHLVF